MKASLKRLGTALVLAFGLVALALGYWSIVRSDSLLAREDNPRLVLAEQQIRRGGIYDRRGRMLAESVAGEGSSAVTRTYASTAAAPIVGYYSQRYGVSGVEAAFDSYLRGELLLTPYEELQRSLLHEAPVGGDVRLTLDLDLQQTAADLLNGESGAIVVLTVPDGDVLAMASAPTFDPNTLNEDWDALLANPDAPLLNRATQGLYPPGEILQTVILGLGLNNGVVRPDEEWTGGLKATVDGALLPCGVEPMNVTTLAEAYVSACPGPFQQVAERIGKDHLVSGLQDFGLLDAPNFTLPAEAANAEVITSSDVPGTLGLGQGDLTVSPLQMALVAAAYSDNGRMPPLHLIDARRDPGGMWNEAEGEGSPRGTISQASVQTVIDLMAQAAESGVAEAASLGQIPVYGHAGLSLSGSEDAYNAWFIGFVQRGDERIAAAVLLEDSANADRAARIGGEMLRKALEVYP